MSWKDLCRSDDWTTIFSTSETSSLLIQIHQRIKSSFVSSATFDLTWILSACLAVIIWLFRVFKEFFFFLVPAAGYTSPLSDEGRVRLTMLSFSLRRGTFLHVGQGDLPSPDWAAQAGDFLQIHSHHFQTLICWNWNLNLFGLLQGFVFRSNWTHHFLEKIALIYYLKHASGKPNNAK